MLPKFNPLRLSFQLHTKTKAGQNIGTKFIPAIPMTVSYEKLQSYLNVSTKRISRLQTHTKINNETAIELAKYAEDYITGGERDFILQTLHSMRKNVLSKVVSIIPNFVVIQGDVTMGNTYNFSGTFNNSILNVDSTLDNAKQNINNISELNPDIKEELIKQFETLKVELNKLSPRNSNEIKEVAESAGRLIETATEQKPVKKKIKLTAEGLRNAAKKIADIAPIIFQITTEIIKTVFAIMGIQK